MKRVSVCFLAALLCLGVVAGAASAKASGGGAGYTLVANPPGSATLVRADNQATAVQLTSSGTSGWGAIGFAVPKGLTLSGVNTLSTDYEFLVGGCQEGSPRFTVGVLIKGTTRELHFYICPAPTYTGGWAKTGNLASQSSFVDDSELPGGSYSEPYSDAQYKYGGYTVKYIAIDLDGGFPPNGTQTVDFENTQVDDSRYTYAP